MKLKLAGALLLLTFLAATVSRPQEKNPPAQQNYAYDKTTQERFEGNVVETRDYSCPVSGAVGSHITVKGDSSVMEVHMAPARFMKQYEITIQKGDHVAIIGSRITYEGKPAIIAKSVTVGRDTYNFRDPKGMPLW